MTKKGTFFGPQNVRKRQAPKKGLPRYVFVCFFCFGPYQSTDDALRLNSASRIICHCRFVVFLVCCCCWFVFCFLFVFVVALFVLVFGWSLALRRPPRTVYLVQHWHGYLSPSLPMERSIDRKRRARNQPWDTHVGPIAFIDKGGRDRLVCGTKPTYGTFAAGLRQGIVFVVQLVSRHSCVADRLLVVVRFPAGPRVRFKTVDPPKGNGLGQKKS